jgi:murein DD-endopeptidase MepM/ murein hydrolase activator NlpD
MIDFSDTIDGAGCATCGNPLGAERFVQLRGRASRAFCTRPCLDAAVRELRAVTLAKRFRLARRMTIGVVFLGACLTPHPWPQGKAPPRDEPPPVAEKKAPPPGWFGPEWPPSEPSLLATLGRDAWVHPLAGPARRMPRVDSRVFGAVRPGNRAWECRNGHCGVDLGGEIWGEHVRAAHDGVVDRVQRAANPEHGGRYVRIAHHGGTVFTQYFHLAAVRRGLERGVPVKGGEIIGLLGDSGVKASQPHLHFAVSIRLQEDRPEKYMDPEPLIALWPLRVPMNGTEAGLVTITAQPGVPLGSMPLLSARARRLAKQRQGGAPADAEAARPAAEDLAAPAEEPSADEPPSAPDSTGDE